MCIENGDNGTSLHCMYRDTRATVSNSGRCAALDNVRDSTNDTHRHHFNKEKTFCPPHYVESAEIGPPAVKGKR